MKIRPIAIAGISVFLISPAIAADPTEKTTAPEVTAITNQAAEYVKAYNAGDAKALAQYFIDDAEYTDENGQLTQGRSGSRRQSLVGERDQGVGRWQRVECRANPHLRRSGPLHI
jgi:uncharacterized protein (DUF1499 family)